MSIIEVKNNLLKFCYEENLILSGFVKITDPKNSYIAQILHLEATRIGKVAVAKILFMLNNNEISAYNGSIPSLRAEVNAIDPSVLLNTLEKNAPLNLGVLAQQNQKLFVDMSVLQDNPIICAEKFFATKVLLNNIALQLQFNGKKVIVFDTAGVFKSNKLTIGKEFKLPLNTSAINYIYEYGFEDATAENKALIQSIFEELYEYSKTIPFIPFNAFKSVVDEEFTRTKLIQLVLLKNKIKQIGDMNIYAETENDFGPLEIKIGTDNTIVVDISTVEESLQQECIKYVYSLLKKSGEEFYSFLPLTNSNSNKEVLTEVYSTENVHTTVICGYGYKFLDKLKQTSKNMFMFTPLKQQKDFGGYNIFLQKLAEDEYIAYGKMTKFVPLIAKLHPIKSDEIVVSEQPKTPENVKVETSVVEKFVNNITPESINLEVPTEETTTENNAPVEPVEQPVEPVEPVATVENIEPVEPSVEPVEPVENVENVEPVSDDEDLEPVEEITTQPETTEETTVEDNSANDSEDILNSIAQEVSSNSEEEQEEVTEEVQAPQATEEVQQEQHVQTATSEELAQALEEVPDVEDDDELSDDDLDMIEELSKPEEAEPQPVEEAPVQVEEPVVQPAPAPVPTPTPAPTPAPAPSPQVKQSTNPVVPEYSSEIPEEDKVNSSVFKQGDRVIHEEFGEGVVEKMINYGDKELCSINFASVGRRLLNPEITEMRKI